MKTCTKCHVPKPLDDFDKRGRHKRRSRCKECRKRFESQVRKYGSTYLRRMQSLRLQKYGMTIEDFERLVKEQDGACAICSEPVARPVVDHNHETGRVRALLCFRCNIWLAAVEDADFLKKALAYLKAHSH